MFIGSDVWSYYVVSINIQRVLAICVFIAKIQYLVN